MSTVQPASLRSEGNDEIRPLSVGYADHNGRLSSPILERLLAAEEQAEQADRDRVAELERLGRLANAD